MRAYPHHRGLLLWSRYRFLEWDDVAGSDVLWGDEESALIIAALLQKLQNWRSDGFSSQYPAITDRTLKMGGDPALVKNALMGAINISKGKTTITDKKIKDVWRRNISLPNGHSQSGLLFDSTAAVIYTYDVRLCQQTWYNFLQKKSCRLTSKTEWAAVQGC